MIHRPCWPVVIALVLGAACTDAVAPSPAPPADVTASLAAPTTVEISWSPRPRSERIETYVIYRNGKKIGESPVPKFADANLAEVVTLTYAVASLSESGIESRQSEPISITTRDATPPRVLQSLPTNGAGPLPVAGPYGGFTVTILFSEAMDSASINASTFVVKVASTGEVINGSLSYNVRQQYAEFKVAAMPPSTTISVTAGNAIKDKAGNPLTAFSFSFATMESERPRVLSTDPQHGAVDVPLDTPIRIVFSERMRPNNLPPKLFGPEGFIPVGASYDTLTNTTTLFAKDALRSKSTYTVEVDGGFPAYDLAGNPLDGPRTFSFTTLDAHPPTVAATFPAKDATGVDPATEVRVTFSEPMDPASVTTANFSVYGASGEGEIAGTVSYDPAAFAFIFKPSAPLTSGMRYGMFLRDAKDATGVRMETFLSYLFTVR